MYKILTLQSFYVTFKVKLKVNFGQNDKNFHLLKTLHPSLMRWLIDYFHISHNASNFTQNLRHLRTRPYYDNVRI